MKTGLNKNRNKSQGYISIRKGDSLKIISKNIWYTDILDLQPGHANPGSSESDLVSGKLKEAVIDTIVIQS